MTRVGFYNPTQFNIMSSTILLIILVVCALLVCSLLVIYGKGKLNQANNIIIEKTHQQNQVKLLQQKIFNLNQNIQILQKQQKDRQAQLQNLDLKIKLKRQSVQKDYTAEKQIIKNQLEQFKKVSKQAASNYIDILQKDYQHAEAAHKQQITKLQAEYNRASADLQVLKDTRKAAFEALLKEQEIKENKENYSLIPSKNDLQDIYTLEHIKAGLHKPRILSMLIWQTYWQPLAKKQFPIILQDKTKTGIYKITNTQNDQCYIGQSLNIYKRWCDHCKAGLGIDTPVGNKLYQSMQKTGLEYFTFELLCECPKEELDEKEKYFIELYQSDLYGFNGTKGNK